MAMIFLDLRVGEESVPGDSTAEGFPRLIEIERMSWEIASRQPGENPDDTTQARAHLEVENLKLEKYFDSASSRLYSGMRDRTKYSKAVVTVLDMTMHGPSGQHDKMLVIELTDVYIESIDVDARESGKAIAVSESVSLKFRTCKLVYHLADRVTLRRSPVAAQFEHTVEKA